MLYDIFVRQYTTQFYNELQRNLQFLPYIYLPLIVCNWFYSNSFLFVIETHITEDNVLEQCNAINDNEGLFKSTIWYLFLQKYSQGGVLKNYAKFTGKHLFWSLFVSVC